MTQDQKKYPAKRIGALPVHTINNILGTNLTEGDVWLSSAAHAHIAKDHPEDYKKYFQYLESAIAKPTFIGQAAHHLAGFEIVYRVPVDSVYILIAIAISRNIYGTYNIKSMYSMKDRAVKNRQNAKRLFHVRE